MPSLGVVIAAGAAAVGAAIIPVIFPATEAAAQATANSVGRGLSTPELILVAGLAVATAIAAATTFLYLRGRQNLALQRAIFHSVPRPRQVVAPDGRTVFANAAFVEFFGGLDKPTPELLIEETGGDEEVRDQVERLAVNAANGIAGHAEIRVPGRSDSRRAGDGGLDDEEVAWRHVAAYPLTGRPGYIFWFVDDITLRRQMEQVIREEQERFVDLLEHAPIGFYSVDRAGRFLFVNRTLSEWLAVPHEDFDNGKVRLRDVVANPLPVGTAAHNPFGVEGVVNGEVSLKGAEGSTFQAFISQDIVQGDNGDGLRTRSVVRHLSRERAMAEALERSEQRFERFFAEAPVGIALLDPQGALAECNRAFVSLTGRSSAELLTLSLLDLLVADDRKAARATLDSGAKSKAAVALAPVEVRLQGESETVCSLYITPMVDSDSALAGFIAHFIDTTEQKNLEVQFAQAQKMQAVGQLAGGIAHDFNNLLTAMIGFSDLLLLRHQPGDQSFADIMQIKQNANRAANLVRQLLAFSRQQTLQPRTLNVTDILAELSHLLRRLIGENIELKMVHGRDLGMIKADQGQLEQVIINLAVNARDAMTDGGILSIRTSNVTIARLKKHKGEVMPPGDYVLIEAADTGCGIPQANFDRIFEPFFSTKEVGAGTGLGLSTVYGIVKQSGGFVFVDSVENKGSTFSIYLPPHRETVEEVERDPEAMAGRDLTGRGTVLLVEDEDAVRAFSARALRDKGYNVMEADSGEMALELLQTDSGAIDLLITDVVMPRLDGPSLVRELREQGSQLKVIFISGYAEDTFRQRLGEDSGIHFLPKPFSLKRLAVKVKEVLAEPAA